MTALVVSTALLSLYLVLRRALDRRWYVQIPIVEWAHIKSVLKDKMLTTDSIPLAEIAFLHQAFQQHQSEVKEYLEEQMQEFVRQYAGEENQEQCA
jgi:hypothetical protein